MRRCSHVGMVSLFHGDLENGPILFIVNDDDIIKRLVTRSTIANVVKPPRVVFYKAT